MMLRSKRLQVVLSLEERREQEALEGLGQAQERLQQQRVQLENLRRYQQEYQERIRQQHRGKVSASQLHSWQAFIGQLDTAIRQQQQQVDVVTREFESRRQAWLQARERRLGMERYIDSCRRQEQREQDARDQKLADEAAGQAFVRRSR